MTMNQQAHIIHRRLAAIFSADVAGYTRLMNVDEAGTLRLLGSHRDVTEVRIEGHGVRNNTDHANFERATGGPRRRCFFPLGATVAPSARTGPLLLCGTAFGDARFCR